ncbi:MAG: hypothetical protein REI64_03470 [Pedobacter sp.]|uniref:hypothetical protein n=1 Tax=Pedobacter sp. TaxID=1411316 RepID=UPI0028069DB8|nr:hypothetical protein [Pedobacter sp.]MDQ8003833.1 hypothetical protein [Pedobacter sp.]
MKENPQKKRSKEEYRQYLQQKKQEEETAQKERQDQIWALHRKALSVKSGDVIFNAKQDLLKIWGVSVLCFSIIVFTVYMLSLMNEQELVREFGSILKGRLFQIGMTLFSSVLFLAVCYFLHNKYVITITLLADSALQIKTWGLFGYKENSYPKEAWIVAPIYHEGKTQLPNTPSVYAPYQIVKPYGEKKLVISDFGNFPFGTRVLDDILNPS